MGVVVFRSLGRLCELVLPGDVVAIPKSLTHCVAQVLRKKRKPRLPLSINSTSQLVSLHIKHNGQLVREVIYRLGHRSCHLGW